MEGTRKKVKTTIIEMAVKACMTVLRDKLRLVSLILSFSSNLSVFWLSLV